jgi:hypothetical protein
MTVKVQEVFVAECLMATMQIPGDSSILSPPSCTPSQITEAAPMPQSSKHTTIDTSVHTPLWNHHEFHRNLSSSDSDENEEIAATPPSKKVTSLFPSL